MTTEYVRISERESTQDLSPIRCTQYLSVLRPRVHVRDSGVI